MKSPCAAALKTAGELLEHGVLPEAVEKLTALHDCGRKAGCGEWSGCIGAVESAWREAAKRPADKRAPAN